MVATNRNSIKLSVCKGNILAALMPSQCPVTTQGNKMKRLDRKLKVI